MPHDMSLVRQPYNSHVAAGTQLLPAWATQRPLGREPESRRPEHQQNALTRPKLPQFLTSIQVRELISTHTT